jgi:uncharacterized membrane protein YdjX (TVP38/TMEM64 family)
MKTSVTAFGGWLHRYDLPVKGVAAVVALSAFVLLLRALPMAELLRWAQDHVASWGAWAPLAFVALFIVLTAAMLPGWPLNVVSGSIFGPVLGGILSSIGSTSAAAVSFLIGRYLAHAWVAEKVPHYPRLSAIYQALAKEDGWKIVAAVRLSHSLPFGLQNFLLGVSPVGFLPYILTTWLITLPGIFLVAYLGYLAGHALDPDAVPTVAGPWYWGLRIGGLIIAAAALFYLGRVGFKALKSHTVLEQRDTDPESDPLATSVWPWGTVTALLAAVLFLAMAVWCYYERENLQAFLLGVTTLQ